MNPKALPLTSPPTKCIDWLPGKVPSRVARLISTTLRATAIRRRAPIEMYLGFSNERAKCLSQGMRRALRRRHINSRWRDRHQGDQLENRRALALIAWVCTRWWGVADEIVVSLLSAAIG